MRTAIATALACLSLVGLSTAADVQASIRKDVSIPAGGLGPALQALSADRHIHIVFISEDVKELQTRGVSGSLTIDEALSRLLDSTGLTFQYIDAETVSIVPAATASSTSNNVAVPPSAPQPTEARFERSRQRYRLAQAQASSGSDQSASPGASAARAESYGPLQEIVVTATRRSQSMLEVPVSMAALDTAGLVKSNIKTIGNLATIVPGITFDSSSPVIPASSSISIRGVTSAGGDPTTGIYLDEASMQASGATGGANGHPYPAVFDLDRVEVLRGPQGTLFGAGAMGGAIRFIQNQPGLQEYTGRATAELGFTEHGGTTYEVGTAFGGPVVANELGFRLSLWQREEGGYIDRIDPITGRVARPDANRSATQAARFAMTWAPGEMIRITPSFYWQEMTSPHSNAYHLAISDRSAGRFRNGGFAGTPITDRFYIPSLTVQADVGFADFIATSTWLRRTVQSSGDLTASFGARGFAFGFPDGFGNPLGVGFAASPDDWETQNNYLRGRSFSQEIRLSSSDPDARLTWTVGAYYGSSEQFEANLWSGVPWDFFEYSGVSGSVDQEQLSGFAQVDLRLLDGLKATVGARYARVEVDLASIDPTQTVTGNAVDTPVSPKVGLEYQFDSNHMAYVSAGKGFRAGGVNLALADTPQCREEANPTYGSDSLWSYEIGTKHRLLDDHATFTASIYRIDWDEKQTGIDLGALCGGSPIVNAGSARIDGFDAAISLTAFERLRLDFSVAYIDAKFSESVFDPSGRPVVLNDYALGFGSPWTMTGSIEYSFQVRGREAFLRAEDTYRTRNTGPFLYQVPESAGYNPDIKPDPSWNMLNLRAGITLGDLQADLFVTNALDTRPVFNLDNRIAGGTFFFANTVTPRTVGINLNYNF